MKLRSTIVRPFASAISKKIDRDRKNALSDQTKIFKLLLKQGRRTKFGKDHDLNSITSPTHYSDKIGIVDYEKMRPYIEMIQNGQNNILWPGKPTYFAKTSGTTSGAKYIPMTRESTPHHVASARNALFNYAHQTKNYQFLDGKLIFLSGSPELDNSGAIPTGRLSGIVNHQVPAWLKTNQLPSYKTNCIEDWEEKLDAIITETLGQDMRLISGIPPWVEMYFERILQKTGKACILDVFPNFSVFVYGGVNYEPYRQKLESLIGRSIDSVETFPASEGFFGFQDDQESSSLLLQTNVGIYYEFIKVEDYVNGNFHRIPLSEVEKDIDYVLIVSTNAGLWAYDVGDTIRFVSIDPYKVLVTGRVKHFISAFGEHVIGKEVDGAMEEAIKELGILVTEYTVAPQVDPPEGGKPYHQWLVEGPEKSEEVAKKIATIVDKSLIDQNIYYEDLRDGQILREAEVVILPKGTFQHYMKSEGKLGGQNKVPRLTNDRKLADSLLAYSEDVDKTSN